MGKNTSYIAKIPNKFLLGLKLARFHKPTGFLLSFFPAALGLFLAFEKIEDLKLLPILFLGSMAARGTGCIINDMFDRNIDAMVERTKDRPLASGELNMIEASIMLLILTTIGFYILFLLSITAIAIGLITVLMIIVYPLTKRFTYFPQVFLGLTFNLGSLIGYSVVKDDISSTAMLLYIACCFWTIGYDTIYAFMDLPDDKKAGIKSTAILFQNKNYKLFIGSCYLIFLTLIAKVNLEIANYYIIAGIIFALILFTWQIVTLDISNIGNCMKRFTNNNYVGLTLMLSAMPWQILIDIPSQI